MQYKNVSAEITDEVLGQLIQKAKEIGEALPFLINLTPREIRSLYTIGSKSFTFVEEALRYAGENPELFPTYLTIDEFRKDLNLYLDLRKLIDVIKPLQEKLNDTMMAAGSEAYSAALAFYEAVKRAAENGAPGSDSIAAALGQRYSLSRRGSQSTEPEPPEDTAG